MYITSALRVKKYPPTQATIQADYTRSSFVFTPWWRLQSQQPSGTLARLRRVSVSTWRVCIYTYIYICVSVCICITTASPNSYTKAHTPTSVVMKSSSTPIC
ncbi:unnamed protein product [Ceratitis capitata]|uniref:(Mediterranean fruit fly) hypothetical protein n=1 Tax=Ceratitis capitata TaxID=7213 RepID=A0A811UM14_CERCA|nr:unnamed protein product [Ceratitis capitata]